MLGAFLGHHRERACDYPAVTYHQSALAAPITEAVNRVCLQMDVLTSAFRRAVPPLADNHLRRQCGTGPLYEALLFRPRGPRRTLEARAAEEVVLMSTALYRLESQLLVNGREPVDVVSHFGAMQGQDLPGVITSIALRTPTKSRERVIDAFNSGELVRTWPQRGTLHVINADRVRDLLVVARARTFPQTVRRREQLGIDDVVLEQARSIARDVVGAGITRKGLIQAWDNAGLLAQQGVAYHLIFHLSLEGLLVWGPMVGKEQRIVLLDEWVPEASEADYGDIVRDIVFRYVRSHAPTTRKDIGWWANLPLREIDQALAGSEYVEKDGWWVKDELQKAGARSLYLLPGFDEMLLGYADRSASLSPDRAADVCPGNNGVFKPTIMLGGAVIGTWQRSTLTASFFEEPSDSLRKRVDRALKKVPYKI